MGVVDLLEMVNIEHATNIFMAARHPKSFIALDGIDHLIKNLITGIGGAISIYLCGDWVMPVIWRIFQKKVVEGESIGGD